MTTGTTVRLPGRDGAWEPIDTPQIQAWEGETLAVYRLVVEGPKLEPFDAVTVFSRIDSCYYGGIIVQQVSPTERTFLGVDAQGKIHNFCTKDVKMQWRKGSCIWRPAGGE